MTLRTSDEQAGALRLQAGDKGKVDAALRRVVAEEDAHPDLHLKAAALLHSLLRNRAVVDGNKRLAWTACLTFLAINGQWISASEDERFDFVIRVAEGADSDLDEIAQQLRSWSHQEG